MKINKASYVLSIVIGVLCSCGEKEDLNSSVSTENLKGQWDVVIYQNECQDPDESIDKECATATSARGCYEYHFLEDGEFKYIYGPGSDEFGTYELDGDEVVIETDFRTLNYKARFEGELLVLYQERFNVVGCREYIELEKIGGI